MKIYHNPRCMKSRQSLSIIKDAGVDAEVIEYLKNTPTAAEIKDLLVKLNLKPIDIIRKGEAIYKEKFKGKNFADEEWVQIMTEHPKLIERPIVVSGNKAVIGRPPENVKELL